MWTIGQKLQTIFRDAGDDIYKSLLNDDHSELVMKLCEKLRHVSFETRVEKKSQETSDGYRKQGNDAYKSHRNSQALIFYNMALCYAPEKSTSLKLAYSNRSALLYELKAFEYALKDIEMCYRLNCSKDLVQKLKVREEKCFQRLNNLENYSRQESSCILTLRSGLNDEIPCASKAVKLDKSGTQLRIVAAEDIDIGTVVALETAFVNTPKCDQNAYITCYHCMKSSLNLIPCSDCCLVMFCNENCKKEASHEYHATECQILHKSFIGTINLALKAVIKIKKEYNNWNEFIEASNNLNNANPTYKYLKSEKFLHHLDPLSMLQRNTDKYVSIGKKASRAVFAAVLIKGLMDTSYFSTARSVELQAICATAKLLMHLFLYSKETILRQSTFSVIIYEDLVHHPTKAFFTFLSKLEHSCHANLIVGAMNNKAVATAVKPIQCGEPLTVSYIGHYLLSEYHTRELHIYNALGTVCSCIVCTEKWDKVLLNNYKLSHAQANYLKEFKLMSGNIRKMSLRSELHRTYQNMCLGLKLFVDLPNTMEYKEWFLIFLTMQDISICIKTENRTV